MNVFRNTGLIRLSLLLSALSTAAHAQEAPPEPSTAPAEIPYTPPVLPPADSDPSHSSTTTVYPPIAPVQPEPATTSSSSPAASYPSSSSSTSSGYPAPTLGSQALSSGWGGGGFAGPTLPSLAQAPGLPSGFLRDVGAASWLEQANPLLQGFHYAVNASATYTSNVNQSQSVGQGHSSGGDFILGIGGNVSYLSISPVWTYGVSYHGNYNEYFKNGDLSGYSQGGGVTLNYTGGALKASWTNSIDYTEGNNSQYGSAFVKQTNFSSGIVASYDLSPKTSFQGTVNDSYSIAGGGNFSDTNSFSSSLSMLWKYSPLTQLGPGIRYTYSTDGGGGSGRSTFGPQMLLNYQLSSLVMLNSRLGLDFASYGGHGGTDVNVSGALGATYTPSPFWSLNFSFVRDGEPDALSAGNFTETTEFQLGYQHKLYDGSLTLTAAYGISDSTGPSSGAGSSGNRNHKDLSLGYNMPLFANSASGRAFITYTDQGGVSGIGNTVLTGISITRNF